jgi:hypothetical protein
VQLVKLLIRFEVVPQIPEYFEVLYEEVVAEFSAVLYAVYHEGIS